MRPHKHTMTFTGKSWNSEISNKEIRLNLKTCRLSVMIENRSKKPESMI
jgi:hypothetical protein